MKPALLLCLLLLTVPAYARLGETTQQIEARYGKPIKATKPESPATDAEVYEKNGFEITVGYYEGKSYYEEFRKPETKEPRHLQQITTTELNCLLKANQISASYSAGGAPETLRSNDGQVEANYRSQVFTIRYLRFEKQKEADEKKREEDNLKDF
jgi:hypothetical protein